MKRRIHSKWNKPGKPLKPLTGEISSSEPEPKISSGEVTPVAAHPDAAELQKDAVGRLLHRTKDRTLPSITPQNAPLSSGAGCLPYFAVSARGMEEITAAELRELGAEKVQAIVGGVNFEADLTTFYRCCLSIRTASRILRPLREFAASTAEMLYSQVRRIRWEDYLNPQRTLAVHATMEGGAVHTSGGEHRGERPFNPRKTGRGAPPPKPQAGGINNTHFAALKVKDAICDRLRREQGARPNVDTEYPDLRVHAHFGANGRCIISLDGTGESLHERGYRQLTTMAPLKETLGAAIIHLSGWKPGQPLLDPMCGSGTLVIEAALQAMQIPPNFLRTQFPFERWPDFNSELWTEIRNAAVAKKIDPGFKIYGSDIDPDAINAAQINAERAGVSSVVEFKVQPAEEVLPPTSEPGILVLNPPYGERLGSEAQVAALYQRLTQHWQQHFVGWKAVVLAGNLSLARHIGLEAIEKHPLYNGPLSCRLLVFPITPAPPPSTPPAPELTSDSTPSPEETSQSEFPPSA